MRWPLFFLLIIAIGGCGKGDFSEKNIDKTNRLRVVYLNSPATLDPSQSQDVYTNDLMGLVYEGLVGWSEDNKIEPRLASAWTVSKDGRTYVFTLKTEAKFTNGKPLEAADVKWTWERNADAAYGSPLAANYLGDIVGVKEKLAGQAKTVEGIQVLDSHTLKITLDKPRPYFLGKLTYPAAYILPKDSTKLGEKIEKIESMIGTGPFLLESYTPDSQITLRANTTYHGGKPTLDKLTIRIVKDATTRLNLFRQGEIDILTLSQQDVEGMKASQTKITTADRAATIYIGMNGTVYKPFQDPRVRRACLMAVDRDYIIEKLLAGVGRRADGILPPAIPMPPRSKTPLIFDPKKAKALLQESGWAGKMPPLELWVNDANKDRKTIAEYVVSQLRENLGIDAKLRLAAATQVIQKATRRELGFFYGSWYADYLDPENFLSVLLADYGQNRTDYDNPRFSALCRQADVEPDPAPRATLYAQAEDLALQDAPWIPLYFPQEAIVIQPWVKGLRQNALGFLPPTDVTIEGR